MTISYHTHTHTHTHTPVCIKRKEETLTENWRDLRIKGTHKHMEPSLKRHAAPSLRLFTYTYSLLIVKDICDCRNVLVKLSCVYVCLSSGDPFKFSVRVSPFFPCFCVIRNSVLSLSNVVKGKSQAFSIISTHWKQINRLGRLWKIDRFTNEVLTQCGRY